MSVVELETQKNEYLHKRATIEAELGEPVSPESFYRDIFPENFLQDAYAVNPDAKHDGKFVAIANVLHELRDGKIFRKNHYVLNDLSTLKNWTGKVAFISPCSFLGGAKDLAHLRYLHAFVVDLDYVGVGQLRDVFHQCRIGFLPTPTYLVNSGTGLHLYYVLEAPVTCYQNQQECYSALKHALIDLCWNEFTSQVGKRQYSGLVQPYRIPGTRTKLDMDTKSQRVVSREYPVTAYRYGEKWTVDKLLAWQPKPNVGTRWFVDRCEGIKKLLNGEISRIEVTDTSYTEIGTGKIPLSIAKEKYPDWYQRRIVNGEPVKQIENYKWHVNPRVYEWWLRTIRESAQPGHRYHCIMCLAIYAIKCNVPYEKLKADAYSLLDEFDGRTDDETNHFLISDINQALRAYRNKIYATYPISSIEYFSGIKINRNKRNWQKQAFHLEEARAIRDIRQRRSGSNWWDNGNRDGAPEKKRIVYEWRVKNPDGRKIDCERETGVSRPTVLKWWNWEPEK